MFGLNLFLLRSVRIQHLQVYHSKLTELDVEESLSSNKFRGCFVVNFSPGSEVQIKASYRAFKRT